MKLEKHPISSRQKQRNSPSRQDETKKPTSGATDFKCRNKKKTKTRCQVMCPLLRNHDLYKSSFVQVKKVKQVHLLPLSPSVYACVHLCEHVVSPTRQQLQVQEQLAGFQCAGCYGYFRGMRAPGC